MGGQRRDLEMKANSSHLLAHQPAELEVSKRSDLTAFIATFAVLMAQNGQSSQRGINFCFVCDLAKS